MNKTTVSALIGLTTAGAITMSGGPAFASASVQGTARPCTVTHLRGKLSDERAAAGAQRWTLTIINDGGTCTVRGYPRLRERTPAGTLAYPHTIHSPVLGVPDEGPVTIRLVHGGTATAALGYGNAGPLHATTVSKFYAGFKGQAGWVPVAVTNGPLDVYLNAISVTALTKG